MRILIGAVAVVVAATGCGLFPSFDGFAGADPDAASPAQTGDASAHPPRDAQGDGEVACGPEALICDGFELGQTSRWSKVVEQEGGTISVVGPPTLNPHAGAWAMRAQLSGGVNPQAFLEERISARRDVTMAVRSYVRLDAVPTDDTDVVEILGPDAVIKLRARADGLWGTRFDNGTASEQIVSTGPIEVGRWVCMELDVVLAEAGRIAVFVDGALRLSAERPVAPAATLFDSARVGLIHVRSATTQVVSFDDVVASSYADVAHSPVPRIGCS